MLAPKTTTEATAPAPSSRLHASQASLASPAAASSAPARCVMELVISRLSFGSFFTFFVKTRPFVPIYADIITQPESGAAGMDVFAAFSITFSFYDYEKSKDFKKRLFIKNVIPQFLPEDTKKGIGAGASLSNTLSEF